MGDTKERGKDSEEEREKDEQEDEEDQHRVGPVDGRGGVRSETGSARHSSVAASLASPTRLCSSAISSSRSAASGRRLSTTSSIRSRSSVSTWS